MLCKEPSHCHNNHFDALQVVGKLQHQDRKDKLQAASRTGSSSCRGWAKCDELDQLLRPVLSLPAAGVQATSRMCASVKAYMQIKLCREQSLTCNICPGL